MLSNYNENIQKFRIKGFDDIYNIRLNEFTAHNFDIKPNTELVEFFSSKDTAFILTLERLERSLYFLKESYNKWNEVNTSLASLDEEKRLNLYFGVRVQGSKSHFVEISLQNSYQMCLESIYYSDKLHRILNENAMNNLPCFLKGRLISIPSTHEYKEIIARITKTLKIKEDD